MSDYQSIVDQIQTAINVSENTPVEKLRALSQEYAQLCQTINRRLADCNKFLQAGNLGEALRLADTTPHLLDLCNLIEFPELGEWNDICRTYQLTVPPNVKSTVVEQLNEGFESLRSLEPLLKRHRYLALTRAPMKERLDVLYQLERAEPENLIWSDMIALFQNERIKEIEAEVAETLNDPSESSRWLEILRELENSPWVEPPTSLIEKVQKQTKAVAAQNYRLKFQNMATNLETAIQRQDFQAAKNELQKWTALLISSKIAESSLPSNVLDVKHSVSKKLAAWEQKNRLCSNFKTKLARFNDELIFNDDLERLATLFGELSSAAEKCDEEIPNSTRNAYEAKILAFRRRYLLKLKIIAAGIILGVVVLIVAILSLQAKRQTRRAIDGDFAKATKLLDASAPDDWKQASEILERLEKKNLDEPVSQKLNELKTRLSQLIEKREQQRLAFQTSIETVRRSLESNEPDSKALAKAKLNVFSEDEKKEFQNLDRKVQEILTTRKNELIDEFQKEYEPLRQKIDDFRNDKNLSAEETIARADDFLKEVDLLPDVAIPEIQKWRTDLANQIKIVRKLVSQKTEIERELAAIDVCADDLPRYFYALETFNEKFPDVPTAKDFQNILDDSDVVLKTLEWNDFVRRYQNSGRTEGSVCLTSPQFIRDFETISAFFEPTTEMQSVEQKIQSLLQATAADFPTRYSKISRTTTEQLSSFLQNYRSKYWLLYREDSDSYYYFKKKPARDEIVRYRADFKGNEVDFPGSPSPLEIEQTDVAPPFRWAIDSYNRLTDDNLLKKDDITAYYETLIQIFQNLRIAVQEEKFDPIVAVLFSEKFLSCYSQDPFFKRLTEYPQRLAHNGFQDSINWFDPKTRTLNDQRKLAEELLTKLSGLDELLNELQKQTEIFSTPLDTIYQPVGFLKKTDGNWICQTGKSVEGRSGELWIAQPNPESGRISLRSVGSLDDGVPSIPFDDRLQPGSPVFLKMGR